MGGYQEKPSKQGFGLLGRFKSCFSTDMSFLRFGHPLLPGTERETLTNGDFPYKCKCFLQKGNFYWVFRASLLSVS